MKRNISATWLTVGIVAVVSTILTVGVFWRPTLNISPAIDTSTLPVTPPVKRLASCPVASLASSSGAWVVPWLDDAHLPDLVPAQAKQLDLLDFFWLALGPSPGTILQNPTDSHARNLDTVLAAAYSANPCGRRFVTIVDNFNGDADPTEAKAWLARILLDPEARQQHVQALATELARHPLIDGLTVDYEFKLPTAADLPLYARTGHLEQLLPDHPEQLVDRITAGYSALIRDLDLAMHHQQRQLRVATLARDQSQMDFDNLPAYIPDYGALAQDADQVILMAYEYHWSSGDPGPIAPLDWVREVWKYAQTHHPPAGRMAIALAAYAYDWPVNTSGKTVHEAADLTPTQVAAAGWSKAGSQDGETHITYRDDRGGLHEVWDAASGLAANAARVRQFCGCSVTAWKVGNADPVGSNLVVSALG
jgi:Glycosyl hydrolases family 18